MQKHEVRLNYQQATQLAQVGRFDDALEILAELNEVKPNTEGILYLMAACHAKTGNKEEALKLCDRLIEEFDHEHAKQMKNRLTAKPTPLGSKQRKRPKKIAPKERVKKTSPDEKPPQPGPDKTVEPADAKASGESEPTPAPPEKAAQDKPPADVPSDAKQQETPADTPADSKKEDTKHPEELPPVQELEVQEQERDSDDDEDMWDEFPSDGDMDAEEDSSEKPKDAAPGSSNTDDIEAVDGGSPGSQGKPLWLILLIAAVSAGATAALIHYVFLYRF